MSDPMSSVEIEDVLSSIRRLVSDDLRPLHRPMPNPAAFRPLAAERMPAPGLDRLILTPALRVVSRQESPTKTVIAALEVAVTEQQGNRWESETGDEAPAGGAETAGPGWADDLWDETFERALRSRQEAAPAPLVLESIRTALADDVAAEPVVATAMGAEPAWNQEADRDEGVAVVADPETPSPADPDWVAQAEAEVLAELADTSADAAPDVAEIFTSRRHHAPPLDDLDDITFDEEVLRDLVRDLIREELQGALGERITRNVRKLVRAEIARAISVQAYE